MNATNTLRAAIVTFSLALSTCGPGTDTTATSATGDATTTASTGGDSSTSASATTTSSTTSGDTAPTTTGTSTGTTGTTTTGTTTTSATTGTTTTSATTGAQACEAIIGATDCAQLVEVSPDLDLATCQKCQGQPCDVDPECAVFPCGDDTILIQGCCTDADCRGVAPFCGMFIAPNNVCVVSDDV